MEPMPYLHHIFLTPTSLSNEDLLTDAALEAVALAGAAGLTMAAVARRLRITPGAVTRRAGSRAAFVEIVTCRFCCRWRRWVLSPPDRGAVPVQLPEGAVELDAVLLWNTLREHARSEALAGRPAPLRAIGHVRDEERRSVAAGLGRRLGRPATPVEVDAFVALIDGVRASMVDPEHPWTLTQARAALCTWLDRSDPRSGEGDPASINVD